MGAYPGHYGTYTKCLPMTTFPNHLATLWSNKHVYNTHVYIYIPVHACTCLHLHTCTQNYQENRSMPRILYMCLSPSCTVRVTYKVMKYMYTHSHHWVNFLSSYRTVTRENCLIKKILSHTQWQNLLVILYMAYIDVNEILLHENFYIAQKIANEINVNYGTYLL